MPSPTPSVEPVSIHAGDTLSWTRTLADYPASAGWVLSYVMVAAGVPRITFSAAPDGDDHRVTVEAVVTGAWAPGRYSRIARVSLDGVVHTVGSDQVEVLPNLAAVDVGTFDPRSHARRMLDAIEAALERRASAEQLHILEYQIAGRGMKNDHATLIKLRAEYANAVARETAASTGRTGRVLLRF